jgi:protein ImuA
MQADKISALRAFLAKPGLQAAVARIPLGHAEADLCLKGGLQRGALHEIFAAAGHEAAATGFAAGLALRVAAGRRLLWIRQDFSTHEYGDLCATGFDEFGVNPKRLLLLSLARAEDQLRAANDALGCAALGAVVIEMPGHPKILDLTAGRRLVLAAAQKTVTAILLRFSAEPGASAAETRWLVRAAPSLTPDGQWGQPVFDVSLVRNRNGKTGQWALEWSCKDGVFKKPKTDPGTLAATPSHRQVAAA